MLSHGYGPGGQGPSSVGESQRAEPHGAPAERRKSLVHVHTGLRRRRLRLPPPRVAVRGVIEGGIPKRLPLLLRSPLSPGFGHYLEELLAAESFPPLIAAALERAYAGWERDECAVCERIVICNGPNCGRNHRTYPIIHYLFNRLVESNMSHLVKIETVNCLKSCPTGPNLYLARGKTGSVRRTCRRLTG